jgi:anti-sigma regulatory factor (Ser/Thr protein kinase)
MSSAPAVPALPATARHAPADLRPATGHCTSTDLPADPASSAAARRITRDALTRWNLHQIEDFEDTAILIASELAANAIAATPPGSPAPAIILTLHYTPPDLTIRVWDIGPGQPDPAAPGNDAEDGRGLLLIKRLSKDWGWWPCPHSGGKVVFATISLPTPPPGGPPDPGSTTRQPGPKTESTPDAR